MTKHKYDLDEHPEVKDLLDKSMHGAYGANHVDYNLALELLLKLKNKHLNYKELREPFKFRQNLTLIMFYLEHSHLIETKRGMFNLSGKGDRVAEKLEEML